MAWPSSSVSARVAHVECAPPSNAQLLLRTSSFCITQTTHTTRLATPVNKMPNLLRLPLSSQHHSPHSSLPLPSLPFPSLLSDRHQQSLRRPAGRRAARWLVHDHRPGVWPNLLLQRGDWRVLVGPTSSVLAWLSRTRMPRPSRRHELRTPVPRMNERVSECPTHVPRHPRAARCSRGAEMERSRVVGASARYAYSEAPPCDTRTVTYCSAWAFERRRAAGCPTCTHASRLHLDGSLPAPCRILATCARGGHRAAHRTCTRMGPPGQLLPAERPVEPPLSCMPRVAFRMALLHGGC